MDIILGSFIWDSRRELDNAQKHGVDFAAAARAFIDPRRKIFVDSRHSQTEPRFFCIGKVGGQVLTVRFVHRNDRIRIFGAGYWRKGAKYYEKDE